MFIVLYILLFILFIYLVEREDPGRDRNRWMTSKLFRSQSLPDTFRQIFRRRGRGHSEVIL